jgi:hypothetical protein
MVAVAGAMVATVQGVAGVDPAEAGCVWVGSDCIEEVVVTAPPDDPSPGPGRDQPQGGEPDPGSSWGGYGQQYGVGHHEPCYQDGDVCIERVTVTATVPSPFGVGEVVRNRAWIDRAWAYFFGDQYYNPPGQDVVDAYGLAVDYLKDDRCNTLLSGPAGDARHVAKYTVFHDSGYAGRDMYGNVASYAKAADQNGGAGLDITIYQTFHGDIDRGILLRTDLIEPPSDLEMRAFVLLHEVGHLTGAVQHPPTEIAAINSRITADCLELTRS